MADLTKLEAIVKELNQLYSISAPPIPIERIIQNPRPGMWDDVDMDDITMTFLRGSTPFSARMSLARFLAKHIARCRWGEQRGLAGMDDDDNAINCFARMIIMPADMVMQINPDSRTPHIIGLHFEVPEEDALLRLKELAAYAR